MGIIERIGALSGTEAAKAFNLAHATFQDRVGEHGHYGRAMIETVVEICRNHPNLVGIAVGLTVEQFLVHEKQHHEAMLAANGGHAPEAHSAHAQHPHAPAPARTPVLRTAAPPHTPHHMLRMAQIRPFRIGLEVFGALLLLKFSAGVAKALRRKNHREIWFAHASKVRLFSGSLAAYYLAKALKAKKVSAWRNAAILLFATDAIKPVLKPDKRWRPTLAPAPAPAPPPQPTAPAIAAPPPVPAPAPAPAEHVAAPPPHEEPHHPEPPHAEPHFASEHSFREPSLQADEPPPASSEPRYHATQPAYAPPAPAHFGQTAQFSHASDQDQDGEPEPDAAL